MSESSTSTSIASCTTGIFGLDQILCGGLPANRLYLVQGDPGVGKTTLSMQFLLAGAEAGQRVLYVTLSETKDEIEQVAASHGWDLSALNIVDLSAIESKFTAGEDSTLFHPSEVELNETVELILAEVEKVRPHRIVLDSLSELRLLSGSSLRYRRELLALKHRFAKLSVTVLLLDNRVNDSHDMEGQSLAHGVISLQQLAPGYGGERRRLRVVKLRGLNFRSGYHDYVIRRGGLEVFPRLVSADDPQLVAEGKLSSGIEGLDTLTGGGLDVGTSNLLVGPAGVGKSVLATVFAVAAANRGEKVGIFTFDENRALFINRAKLIQQDLTGHIKDETIRLRQINPAEIGSGEFSHIIRSAVGDGVKLIIIDSVNGYWASMPEERHLPLHLHEICSFCATAGATVLLLAEQKGVVGQMEMPIDVTYLADTVLLFRHFESQGKVRQALAVLKKRSGSHERTIRELDIDSHGVRVGEALTEFHGVLSGVPVYHGDPNKMMKQRHA